VDNDIPLARILTDRGREFCGERQDHVYELYLNSENIAHITTRTANPQGNRICKPFHDTLHQEFYDDALRKQYRQLSTLQADLDKWIADYNAHGMLSPFKRARAQRKTLAQTMTGT
jgi:transposase InsO family protein